MKKLILILTAVASLTIANYAHAGWSEWRNTNDPQVFVRVQLELIGGRHYYDVQFENLSPTIVNINLWNNALISAQLPRHLRALPGFMSDVEIVGQYTPATWQWQYNISRLAPGSTF